jgi:hypothetical protein
VLSFFFELGVSCIRPVYYGLRLFAFLEYILLIKKEKKVPGLGGYSMAFFQACWVVLNEDIIKVFHDLHANGKFERNLNATFLSFILKILGAVNPKDFHPISLVGSIYKITAKILANKLKMVLE